MLCIFPINDLQRIYAIMAAEDGKLDLESQEERPANWFETMANFISVG